MALSVLLALPMLAHAQSRIPTHDGRDPQLQQLNRQQIEQRRAIESSRAARENQLQQQRRLREEGEQRREDLRQRMEDVQEDIRRQHEQSIDENRHRMDLQRERYQINRREVYRDQTRARTSGNSSAQNQLRNHIDAEQRRNNRRLRSQREATSNRFLSQRYFQSRERR